MQQRQRTYNIRTSAETAIKQEHLQQLLRMLMSVAKPNMRAVHDPHFWLYDLNAARSSYKDAAGNEVIGSSRLGVEAARQVGLDYRAFLCEIQRENAEELSRWFSDDKRVTVLHGDHKETLPPVLPPRWAPVRFGYVYADPNDAILPLDLLASMFSLQAFRCVDLIINVAATSVKRMGKQEMFPDLVSRVRKKRWLIREPHGMHQWTFLVGTNWEKCPAWREFRLLESDAGQATWERVTMTEKERLTFRQSSLF